MRKNKQIRKLWYSLSSSQRHAIRRLYYYPADLADIVTGKRNKYAPPRGIIYTGAPAGASDFLKQGVHQKQEVVV